LYELPHMYIYDNLLRSMEVGFGDFGSLSNWQGWCSNSSVQANTYTLTLHRPFHFLMHKISWPSTCQPIWCIFFSYAYMALLHNFLTGWCMAKNCHIRVRSLLKGELGGGGGDVTVTLRNFEWSLKLVFMSLFLVMAMACPWA
jgi:hypothetical protein